LEGNAGEETSTHSPSPKARPARKHQIQNFLPKARPARKHKITHRIVQTPPIKHKNLSENSAHKQYDE